MAVFYKHTSAHCSRPVRRSSPSRMLVEPEPIGAQPTRAPVDRPRVTLPGIPSRQETGDDALAVTTKSRWGAARRAAAEKQVAESQPPVAAAPTVVKPPDTSTMPRVAARPQPPLKKQVSVIDLSTGQGPSPKSSAEATVIDLVASPSPQPDAEQDEESYTCIPKAAADQQMRSLKQKRDEEHNDAEAAVRSALRGTGPRRPPPRSRSRSRGRHTHPAMPPVGFGYGYGGCYPMPGFVPGFYPAPGYGAPPVGYPPVPVGYPPVPVGYPPVPVGYPPVPAGCPQPGCGFVPPGPGGFAVLQ